MDRQTVRARSIFSVVGGCALLALLILAAGVDPIDRPSARSAGDAPDAAAPAVSSPTESSDPAESVGTRDATPAPHRAPPSGGS